MNEITDYPLRKMGPWAESVNYNFFFHPNICHICKNPNNGNLIPCENCYMIFYCSNKHKLKDYINHFDFCWNLKLCLQEIYGALHQKLRHEIEEYEVAMIYGAKSCRICYRQTNLHTCLIYYSDNYCDDHKEEFQERHASKCKDMELFLNINILNITHKEFPTINSEFPDSNRPFDDMKSFLEKYIHCDTKFIVHSGSCLEYVYSDYLSKPLIVYDGMKNASLLSLSNFNTSRFVIHVICASVSDKLNVNAWELLLHYLPWIKQLTIVLIGIRLPEGSGNIKLCNKCFEQNKQTLNFMAHCMLYKNYVDSPLFEQPNMILGFHVDFNFKIWMNSILAIKNKKCPIILCALQLTGEYNIIMIKERLNITPVYNKPTKFTSLVPTARFGTDDITYENISVIIYRSLLLTKREAEENEKNV